MEFRWRGPYLWFCVHVRAQEEIALTQKACQDLSENLRRTVMEKETCDLKSSAEIDDLYRTKRNLEERLIELIRYSCLPAVSLPKSTSLI